MPFCSKCGKEVQDDQKFCKNCGTPLSEKVKAPQIKSESSQYASLGSRIVAGLIDYIIMLVIALVIFIITFGSAILSRNWGRFGFSLGWLAGIFGLQFLLWLVYFTYFEGNSGQTIGKRVAGIKVVKDNGSNCDYGSALIRTILRIIDRLPFLYLLGIILIAGTDKKQRLGDMLANTIVVNIQDAKR